MVKINVIAQEVLKIKNFYQFITVLAHLRLTKLI